MPKNLKPVSADQARRTTARLKIGESVTQLCEGVVVRTTRLAHDRFLAESRVGQEWTMGTVFTVDLDPRYLD